MVRIDRPFTRFWLQDVPWHRVLNPFNGCQWDRLAASDGAISGFMRTAQGQHIRSSLEEDDHSETWVIHDSTRRRVTTFKAYDCLIAKGNLARLYPGEFLSDYLPRGLPDLSPEEACKRDGCALSGTDMGSGAVITAEYTVIGNRTTNGQDNSTIDDGNPGLYTSTRWYGIRWGDGRFGYISEVWIRADFRGGLGLRNC